MALSMYAASVPVYLRMLNNLSEVLDKAASYAQAKKIEASVLLSARLFPDMFPLLRQVQIACDFAKGSACRLAGQEPPKWTDEEASIEDLKARIQKTITLLNGLDAAQFEGSEERTINLVVRGEPVQSQGQAYLLNQALPNFYFHVTTAYAILRHNGVELGKSDFIGRKRNAE